MNALLNFADNRYTLNVTHAKREIVVDCAYDLSRVLVQLALNHITVFGFDCVLKGEIALGVSDYATYQSQPVLQGEIRTDYCIFNFLPLRDFQGTFVVEPDKVSDINLYWGNVYRLTGMMMLNELNQTDLLLDIAALDLDEMPAFSQHPLRYKLCGSMSGEIAITESAHNPVIQGDLVIKDGTFGKLSYENAQLHFEGNKFMLNFYDSRIIKRGRSFHVKGNIDFTRNNIFNNVAIQTSERLVIWKGWDIGSDRDHAGFAVSKKIADQVMLNVHTGQTTNDNDEYNLRSEVKLEYALNSISTLSAEAVEENDEGTFNLRHTTRF